MFKLYQTLTDLGQPLFALWLWVRKLRGKEDPRRLRERLGYASKPRPAGALMWLHAASVGEANSVLALISRLREKAPALHLLITTGTVTSAGLLATRLPKGVIHQYVPLDTPEYTRRFMHHWKPEIALFVESELWPNLLSTANRYQCVMGIVNGRMSARTFASWQKRPAFARALLGMFNVIFAQSEEDKQRFAALGARNIHALGNLKFDGALLSCDESALTALKQTLGARPVWLAASTHPEEEARIAQVHALLSATRPNLLTILVPRHPSRGAEIVSTLSRYGQIALRSHNESVSAGTAFYVADTLGELGLFYRLSEIVFMGGSLIPHGGQNPLEAARLSCAILSGGNVQNFADIYAEMQKAGACQLVAQEKALAATVDHLLNHAEKRSQMGRNAKYFVESKGGATESLMQALTPLLTSLGVA